MTFNQLFEITKKHLKMVGTNVTRGETIYMDHIHTPDMSVAKGGSDQFEHPIHVQTGEN